MLNIEGAERIETLRFFVELNKSEVDRLREPLKILNKRVDDIAKTVRGGDSLKVSYAVNLSYFGNVVQSLEALNKIISDPNVLVSVDLQELQHGRSVLASLLDSLRDAQVSIKKRRSFYARFLSRLRRLFG